VSARHPLRSALTDRRATGCFAAMVVAGDFEFRRRDVTAATGGAVDVFIVAELAVFAAIGAWVLATVARPPGTLRRPLLLRLLAALSTVLAISALWAPSQLLGIARGFQLLVSTGFVLAVAARATPQTWHRIAHGYVVVVSVAIATGLVHRKPGELQLTGRFMWLYGHPVVSASMLTISALLLVAWWTDNRLERLWSPTAYGLLTAAHVVALAATETRGSLAAFVAGLGTYAVLRQRRGLRRDTLLVVGLAVPPLVGLALPLLEAVALRGETVDQLKSLNSRAGLWLAAWDAFRQRPLWGQGYFSSRELFLDTIGLGGAHNAYIEIALSAGLVGLVLFMAVLVVAVRRLRALGTGAEQALLSTLMVALLVNALTAQYLAQSGTSANLLFLLVVAWTATAATARHNATGRGPAPSHRATPGPARSAGR